MPVQPSIVRKNRVSARLLVAVALACSSSFSHANRADLDLAFGVDGVVRVAVSNGGFNDVLVQPDGRIVAVGMSGSDWLIARFNSDGSLDDDFGNGGVRTVTPPVVSLTDKANAVTLDASGRIVVAGGRYVMRLDATGNLDAGYGTGGIYAPPLSAQQLGLDISDIVVSSDGGFLLSCTVSVFLAPSYSAQNISALKLTSAAVVDPGFGTGGYASVPESNDRIYNQTHSVREWNGNVYVAGRRGSRTFSYQPEVVRFGAAGTLDITFGSGGILVPFGAFPNDPNAAATELAVQSASGLIVAGAGALGTSFQMTRAQRITAGGLIDPGFADPGIERPSAPLVSGLLVDADSRIVFASTTSAAPIIASMLVNGASDTDFGTAGRRDVPFDGQPAAALALQSDGKYLLAGGVGSSVAYLARLRGTAVIAPEVTTTPLAGTTLAASGGVPGATQSMSVIQFENRGGDDLVVSDCTASAGFSASASFPLTITSGNLQNVAVSCQMPVTPLTTVSGTLSCSTNDPDALQLDFALQCSSGTGTGGGGATAIPTLEAGVQWLLGGLLALLALATIWRPFAARDAQSR